MTDFHDRCGAYARSTGDKCRAPVVPGKRRCKLHGGLSTGPRTPEGRKRIQALERLYRLDLEESARQASPEENLEVPVINAFMLDESHAKELDLALDLIVNTEKRRLSRGQALARLARFYIQSHKPARRERACRLKQVGK